MKFKAGDRVKIKVFKQRPDNWNYEGQMDHLMGKIVTIAEVSFGKLLVFDEKYGRKLYFLPDQVMPVNQKAKSETIVIYRNGAEVIALDKRDGKKAVAKCSPEDTFDFVTGAKIAFGRLIGEEQQKQKQPEYWSGKAVCVKCLDRDFTVGKVYTFENGYMRDNHGYKRPIGSPIKKLDDYKGIWYEFIEYKGENGDAK